MHPLEPQTSAYGNDGRRNRSIATTQALSNSTELPSPWGSGSTEIPNARSDRRRSSVVSTTDVFDAPHTSHSICEFNVENYQMFGESHHL